jgi:hypothetical protein
MNLNLVMQLLKLFLKCNCPIFFRSTFFFSFLFDTKILYVRQQQKSISTKTTGTKQNKKGIKMSFFGETMSHKRTLKSLLKCFFYFFFSKPFTLQTKNCCLQVIKEGFNKTFASTKCVNYVVISSQSKVY